MMKNDKYDSDVSNFETFYTYESCLVTYETFLSLSIKINVYLCTNKNKPRFYFIDYKGVYLGFN